MGCPCNCHIATCSDSPSFCEAHYQNLIVERWTAEQKILLMDVWALAPPDRYVTLIVLGTALLSMSFLYTRFSEKIRKFL